MLFLRDISNSGRLGQGPHRGVLRAREKTTEVQHLTAQAPQGEGKPGQEGNAALQEMETCFCLKNLAAFRIKYHGMK